MKDTKLQHVREKQNNILRDPAEIFGLSFDRAGITNHLFKTKVSGSFIEILDSLNVTLLVTREYENLIVALTTLNHEIGQSFFHLPHPSGIVFDETAASLYVTSTRNPNQVIEFKPEIFSGHYQDQDIPCLMPARTKYYGGAHYFHDLGIIGGALYANSVGKNGIMNVDFKDGGTEPICWWPRCIDDSNGQPRTEKNFIQLNSIAAGESLEDSFFSASCDSISHRRPGHLNFKVDKRGVIFSGKSREAIAGGLTRPHSARLNSKVLWVNNSGYGEVGFIEGGVFKPVQQFNGWTRGLCFRENYMFVGLSKILPRFRHYAPGIKSKNQSCGIAVVDTRNHEVVASLEWPNGNQIFGIEIIPKTITSGFPFRSTGSGKTDIKNKFSNYIC